jgi:hypothetical protein
MDLKNAFAIAVAILIGTSALASAQTGEGFPPYIQPGSGYPFGYSYYNYGYAPGYYYGYAPGYHAPGYYYGYAPGYYGYAPGFGGW